MRWTLGMGVSLGLAALIAVGCADDEQPADSAVRVDVASASDSAPGGDGAAGGADAAPDLATDAAPSDGGGGAGGDASAGLPCSKLVDCVINCQGSVPCAQVCEAKGTPKARTLVKDFMTCWSRVIKAECKVCTEAGKQSECGTCLALACFFEGAACLLDV